MVSKNFFIYQKENQPIFIYLLVIAACGPYVSQKLGVRFEHLIIYPATFFLTVISLLKSRGIAVRSTSGFILVSLGMATVWTFTVTLFLDQIMPALKVVASIENYLQVIALVLALSLSMSFKKNGESSHYLKRACFAVCLALCINSIISVLQIFFDTWPIVKYFVRGHTGSGFSVWQNAVSNGRFSGIYNQPAEAGLSYSIALMAWVYWVSKTKNRIILKIFLLSGLFLGGLLSVSKVFILGGVPLFVFYVGWVYHFKLIKYSKVMLKYTTLTMLFCLPIFWVFGMWKGIGYFLRLFSISNILHQGLVYFYTSGRFGAGETRVKMLFKDTWQLAPIHGFGFGLPNALDNGYLEFFYQGGAVGLLFFLLVLLAIFYHIIVHFKHSKHECKLLFMLLLIIMGASIGAPVITLNRAS